VSLILAIIYIVSGTAFITLGALAILYAGDTNE